MRALIKVSMSFAAMAIGASHPFVSAAPSNRHSNYAQRCAHNAALAGKRQCAAFSYAAPAI
jgi:hypothetical protein